MTPPQIWLACSAATSVSPGAGASPRRSQTLAMQGGEVTLLHASPFRDYIK